MSYKIIFLGKDENNDAEPIKKEVDNIITKLSKFFNENLDDFIIRIHNNRESFNSSINKKTEDWEVANASFNSEIDILSPLAFEKYSSHKKEEFYDTLEHEIIHLFTYTIKTSDNLPAWLDEGMANYFSKEYRKLKFKNDFYCKNFVTDFSEYSDFYKNSRNAYRISYFFVNYLMENFGLDKIKEFLLIFDRNKNNDSVYLSVFKSSKEELELEMLNYYNHLQ